jgi:hypothetical protein
MATCVVKWPYWRMRGVKTDIGEELISRPALARRWGCHVETLRRREKEGQLHPMQMGKRMIRYRMAEVLAIEAGAAL